MTDKTKQKSPDLRTRSGLGQKPWHSAGEKEKLLLSGTHSVPSAGLSSLHKLLDLSISTALLTPRHHHPFTAEVTEAQRG